MNSGKIIKEKLGLSKFNYIYIQKIMNVPMDIYIVIVDSRYPGVFLSVSKIRRLESFIMAQIDLTSSNINLKQFKLTPPINLDEFSGRVSSHAIFIRVDLAGEYYSDSKMFRK